MKGFPPLPSPTWRPPSKDYDRYFTISSQEPGLLTKLSPFLIGRTISQHVGNVCEVKKLKCGDLHIKVRDEKQCQLIKSLKQIGSVNVKVTSNSKLNSSKGIINFWDLINSTENEILEELESQNVTHVKPMYARSNPTSTSTFLLTFSTSHIPEYVKVGYQIVSVKQYVPNPPRCFKCFSLTHISTQCSEIQKCYKCGKDQHSELCESPINCKNCGGSHFSTSTKCPVFLAEKEVRRISVTEKMSYSQAKKLVSQPANKLTYATLTKTKTESKSTQTTDLTAPLKTSQQQQCNDNESDLTAHPTSLPTTQNQTNLKTHKKIDHRPQPVKNKNMNDHNATNINTETDQATRENTAEINTPSQEKENQTNLKTHKKIDRRPQPENNLEIESLKPKQTSNSTTPQNNENQPVVTVRNKNMNDHNATNVNKETDQATRENTVEINTPSQEKENKIIKKNLKTLTTSKGKSQKKQNKS